MLFRSFFLFLSTVFLLQGTTQETNADEYLWALLKSNDHFAMVRHAIAPGFSDPPNFEINNCDTQRNLDDVGRKQATQIGLAFRKRGITEAEVYSSQWCRCRDTANLMSLGKVRDLPALNSFFEREENEKPQMIALRSFLLKKQIDLPLILVSHYVNIGALTGTYPKSGGIVVVRRHAQNSFIPVGELNIR